MKTNLISHRNDSYRDFEYEEYPKPLQDDYYIMSRQRNWCLCRKYDTTKLKDIPPNRKLKGGGELNYYWGRILDPNVMSFGSESEARKFAIELSQRSDIALGLEKEFWIVKLAYHIQSINYES